MNDDRRNPYLVLGVPYGTGRDDATAAFAARSRRARRDGSFPYSVDDLTWALNQVEAHLENPAADVNTYRIPADPDSLKAPPGPGVLRLKPLPVARRTEPATQDDHAVLQSLAARETLAKRIVEQAPTVAARYGLNQPPLQVKPTGSPSKSHRGRIIAVLVAVMLIAAAIILAVIIAGNTSGDASSAATTIVQSTTTHATVPAAEDLGPVSTFAPDGYDSEDWSSVYSAETLAVDDCFDYVQDPSDSTSAIATVVSCDKPHRYQVSSLFSVRPEVTDFSAVFAEADAVCAWNQSSFVGQPPASSIFRPTYLAPAEERWPLDRSVICMVSLDQEQLWDGSANGSKL